MTKFQAHFDGRVLIPDVPVSLPTGCPLQVQVASVPELLGDHDSLAALAELAQQFPVDPDWPVDGAAQLDHYLYGLPKRT